MDEEIIETGILTLPYEIRHDPEDGTYWWVVPSLQQDSFDAFTNVEAAVADIERMFEQ